MLPFLGFSQQEQPKRVTVVVTAKEITPQKEVVQLPADNMPTTVNSKPKATSSKKSAYTTAKAKTAVPTKSRPEKAIAANPKATNTAKLRSKVATKENTVAKAIVKPNPTPKPVATPPVKKEEVIAKAKPTTKVVKEQAKPEKEIATPAPITRAALPSNKAETTVAPSKEDALVKTESNKDTPQLSPDEQTNATSYIWIGVFLIIAGVVLGLLFGKPAFLISFVGVVFVALGIII
ncbi:DUF308 domain-containing protein [Pedobacter chitinilyticus]|nr:DUF308 domain-containing protein [Pedobacter chitinilyticus]